MPKTEIIFSLFKLTFEPQPDSDFQTFSDVLDNPVENPIALQKSGNQFSLDGEVKKTGDIYQGVFCLIQSNQIPPKISPGRAPERLLPDDEESGLGYYTSFLYDSSNDIICIQKNRNGVSPTGLVAYFSRNYRNKDLYLEFVIDPAKLSTLDRLSSLTTLEVAIAKVQSGALFGTSTPKSIESMKRLADDTNANVMKIHIGVGYDRSSFLRKAGVLSIIRSLLNVNQPYEVREVKVHGREDDENSIEIVDLINNRVHFTVSVDSVRAVDRDYVKTILRTAKKQYDQMQPGLSKTYKIKRK